MSLVKPLSQKFQALRAAIKERGLQARRQVSAWWQTHRRAIGQAVLILLIGLLAGLILALLWRRSPALRAAVIGAAAAAAAFVRARPGQRVEPVPVLEPTDNHREPIPTF
jgi:hypothetical protein